MPSRACLGVLVLVRGIARVRTRSPLSALSGVAWTLRVSAPRAPLYRWYWCVHSLALSCTLSRVWWRVCVRACFLHSYVVACFLVAYTTLAFLRVHSLSLSLCVPSRFLAFLLLTLAFFAFFLTCFLRACVVTCFLSLVGACFLHSRVHACLLRSLSLSSLCTL